MRLLLTVAIAGATLFAGQTSVGQPRPTSAAWGIGPLDLGMTPDQLRAAISGTWIEQPTADILGRRVREARNAITAYGEIYDVRVTSGDEPDNYEIYASRQISDETISGCTERGLKLLAKLEIDFGTFGSIVTVPDFRRSCFNSDDLACVRYGDKIQTASGSTVARNAKDKQGNLIAFQRPDDPSVHAFALGAEIRGARGDRDLKPQLSFGTRFETGTCRLSLEMSQSLY